MIELLKKSILRFTIDYDLIDEEPKRQKAGAITEVNLWELGWTVIPYICLERVNHLSKGPKGQVVLSILELKQPIHEIS
jgi:hypothetical protein